MADIDALQRINPTISTQQASAVQSQRTDKVDNDVAKKAIDETKEAGKILPEEEEKYKPELENVVAVSEFGDTVQVSDEGQEELDESKEAGKDEHVSPPTQEQQEEKRLEEQQKKRPLEDIQADLKSRAKEIDEEEDSINAIREEQSDEKAEEKAIEKAAEAMESSYEAYTNSQLQKMYQDGEISRYDYETELEEREEEKEEKIAEAMGRVIDVSADSARKAEAVELAYANPNGPIDAEARLEAIENIENAQREQEDQQAQQTIQRENEKINFWVS